MAFILAGLGLYLYMVEFPAHESEEQEAIVKKKVLSLDEQAITSLTFKTDRESLTFERTKDKGWMLTAPIHSEADQRELQSLIRAIVTGTVKRIVEDKPGSLAPFGLDTPVTTITINASGQEETLAIGDSGPLSSTLYVLRGSDNSVLLSDLAPKDFVNKSLMTFRRKDILHITQSEIDRVRLTYPTTEIVLYRVSDKPKPKWRIRYPIEAEADLNEIRILLFRLEDLKAMGIVDPGPERKRLAENLTAPKVKITLHQANGDQTVKLYQPDSASGEAIAETAPDAPLYRINPTFITDFSKDLFNFQDKRLLGADPSEIAILQVKTRSEQFSLINQSGEWVLEDSPSEKLHQEAAELFVSRVANTLAELRVVKQTSPLAPYGLVSPVAEFVAIGRDGKLAGKLLIGDQANGLAYATGQRLQGIYQIRADILNQVPKKSELFSATNSGGNSPG